MAKNLPATAGDMRNVSSIPGWGRFPGEGNGNPLQYSCLEINYSFFIAEYSCSMNVLSSYLTLRILLIIF